MQFKSQSRVSSIQPSKGEYEGRPYDSTKVFVETPLSADALGWGHVTVQYNWGLSDNYDAFMKKYGNDKPFDAEITWENISKGTTSKLVLLDVKPIQTQAKA